MSNSLCSVDICFVDVVVDGPFDHYADHAKKPFLLLVFLVSINLFHSSPNECFMCLPVISLADFFLSFSPQFLMRLRQHHAYNLYMCIYWWMLSLFDSSSNVSPTKIKLKIIELSHQSNVQRHHATKPATFTLWLTLCNYFVNNSIKFLTIPTSHKSPLTNSLEWLLLLNCVYTSKIS